MNERNAKEKRGQEHIPLADEVPLAEKILGIVAGTVVVAWIVHWFFDRNFDLFQDWFHPLSFFAALLITLFIVLKLFGAWNLSPRIDRFLLGILSLLPVVGLTIELIKDQHSKIALIGSIALAYISATTYWRRHIPEFALNPLGEKSDEAEAPETPAAETPAPETPAPAAPPAGEARPPVEEPPAAEPAPAAGARAPTEPPAGEGSTPTEEKSPTP